MSEFERAFVQQQLFSSALGVCYKPNILITSDGSASTGHERDAESTITSSRVTSQQSLAPGAALGKRFPSFKVINHCDAQSWHFAEWLKADGLFHIVLFAGDVSLPSQMERVHAFAREVAARSRLLRLRHYPNLANGSISGKSINRDDAVANIWTIHSALRQNVEFHDFPALLRPYDDELGYDYNRIFVDEESYYEGHGHAYEGYGVDKTRGCVTVVRPDHHVAWIGELEDVARLEACFAGFLVGQ